MVMMQRKAEVRKSLPNLVKIFFHWVIIFPLAWSMAHFAVLELGGEWPEFSFVHLVSVLVEEFGGLMVVIGGMTAVYEIFRKRE